MSGYVAAHTNKLDAKGRVSIPAPFRTVLARDGYDGLYCFPSPHSAAIDAGGNILLSQITSRLSGLDPLSEEYNMMSIAYFGSSETLKIDSGGRIMLSPNLRDVTGITDTVVFVGLNDKFQIWEPGRYAAYSEASRKFAFGKLGTRAGQAVVE